VLFHPKRDTLREQYEEELKAARVAALQTNNTGALIPAEAKCYCSHTRNLIVSKANCLAEAFTSFSEPAGKEANDVLAYFAVMTAGARKASFIGQAQRAAAARGRPNAQASLAARGQFEREANKALVEGWKILDVQRVQMENRPPTQPANHTYSASGHNARININSTDHSTNLTIGASSDEVFRQIRQELARLVSDDATRAALINCLEELEQAPSCTSAWENYNKFIALAANHATVLSPFLPPLMIWLSTHHPF
jgi:hypothetical protein